MIQDDKIKMLKEKQIEIEREIKKTKLENKLEREKNRVSNPKIRVSKKFNAEIKDIQNKRMEDGLDNYPIPGTEITNLVCKHNSWVKIKKDVRGFLFEKKNKRGQFTMFLMVAIVLFFLASIFLMVGGVVVVKMNKALDINISAGQVNLAEENAKTVGKLEEMYVNNADWWGIAIIFGMFSGMFISSYLLRNKYPKFGIVLDIIIILAAFFVSIYISQTYQTILNIFASSGDADLLFLETYAPKTSMFMLNLPIFVTIVGVICMVLFHSTIPRKSEESIEQTGGFLRGV